MRLKLFRLDHFFGIFAMPDSQRIAGKFAPIHFAHTGINSGQHLLCASLAIRALRHGL